jgi:uncharacterized protein YjbI with pentapeptide repeats
MGRAARTHRNEGRRWVSLSSAQLSSAQLSSAQLSSAQLSSGHPTGILQGEGVESSECI